MIVEYQKEDEIQLLNPAVKFYCQVKGKDLTAHITALVDHPIHFAYRICFSDGYEDDFYILEGGFIEGDKNEISKPYAYAIKDDLKSLSWIQAGKEILSMRWMIDGVHTNIWIKEDEENGDKIFSVHFNSNYRFEMKKDGAGWFWRSRRKTNPEKINDKLAAEIGRLIDKEHQSS